jgi:hypothetical protein
MNPILILKLLLVGVIIGGIIMYGIGRRNTEKIEIDKKLGLKTKAVFSPLAFIIFLIKVLFMAALAFVAVLFITKI